ncbi:hypothetical protein QUF55_03610 [Clostridiaceae bacterium HSG29]|nr:hypothetical protein [Clostridiaceae bacterium HSG29]
MSKQMKYSVFHLILWSIVGILFLIIFISQDAINNWGDNKIKSIMLALLFIFGFGGEYILRFIFRKKPNMIIRDERDDKILAKALGSSFVGTILYIYLISISLYIRYEQSGFVPVGWLWFIAYSLIVIANIFTSIFSIIFYRSEGE